MKSAKGGEPGRAVIVTADENRVREIEIDLKQRGYEVTILDPDGVLSDERSFAVGVFDLTVHHRNPVVLAAGLLADGRLDNVEFMLPGPGVERTHAADVSSRAQRSDEAVPAA